MGKNYPSFVCYTSVLMEYLKPFDCDDLDFEITQHLIDRRNELAPEVLFYKLYNALPLTRDGIVGKHYIVKYGVVDQVVYIEHKCYKGVKQHSIRIILFENLADITPLGIQAEREISQLQYSISTGLGDPNPVYLLNIIKEQVTGKGLTILSGTPIDWHYDRSVALQFVVGINNSIITY